MVDVTVGVPVTEPLQLGVLVGVDDPVGDPVTVALGETLNVTVLTQRSIKMAIKLRMGGAMIIKDALQISVLG